MQGASRNGRMGFLADWEMDLWENVGLTPET